MWFPQKVWLRFVRSITLSRLTREPSAFYRAFHSWYAMTPKDVRQATGDNR